MTTGSFSNNALTAPASEDAVIGALARFPELLNAGQALTENDFDNPFNREIFTAIRKIAIRNHVADFASITDEIIAKPGSAEMLQHLVDVAKQAPTKTMFTMHCKLLKDASARRMLAAMLQDSLSRLNDRDNELADVLDRLTSAARTAETGSPLTTQTDAVISAMTLLDARAREAPYDTGIANLNRVISGGLHRGELTIIGARPAVGKTALALWLATHIARAGKHVVYISREMQSNRLILRQVQGNLNFDSSKLRTGRLTDAEWSDVSAEFSAVAELPITYIERVGEIERIRSEIRAAQGKGKCDVVIIDYLQLICSADRTIDKNEYTRISYVSRVLKELTLELDIPVVALAQVNRSGDREAPTLSELKGSGSIEQDADNVVLLHRTQSPDEALPCDREMWPCYHNAGEAYLIVNIAKQRDGMTGKFPLLFVPEKQTYIEIAREARP